MSIRVEGALSRESSSGLADSIPKIELPFTVVQGAESVPDGHVDTQDHERYIFPGVSSCVPIVIHSEDGNRVFAAIHANAKWGPDELRHLMESIPLGSTVEYLEHKSTNSVLGSRMRGNNGRTQILSWLIQTQAGGKYHTKRTILTSDEGVVHVVFDKHEGWKQVVFP